MSGEFIYTFLGCWILLLLITLHLLFGRSPCCCEEENATGDSSNNSGLHGRCRSGVLRRNNPVEQWGEYRPPPPPQRMGCTPVATTTSEEASSSSGRQGEMGGGEEAGGLAEGRNVFGFSRPGAEQQLELPLELPLPPPFRRSDSLEIYRDRHVHWDALVGDSLV